MGKRKREYESSENPLAPSPAPPPGAGRTPAEARYSAAKIAQLAALTERKRTIRAADIEKNARRNERHRNRDALARSVAAAAAGD